MKEPEAYRGREQTYLKHFFLERYLERVASNIGWANPEFVYVDGFSGPWRSEDEEFEDTSFMIAVNQLRKVRDALAERGRRPGIRCLFVECGPEAFAGLRTAETLSLLPSQVRVVENGGLGVVDLIGKGGKRRTVAVLPGREKPILHWLESRRKLDIPKRIQVDGGRVSPPLLCSISQPCPGRPLIARNMRKMIKRRAIAAGIARRVHLHGLRHFHAFQLAQRGVKLHVVQQQLGHSRLDTTSTYIAPLSAKDIGDEIRRAFERDVQRGSDRKSEDEATA